MAEVGAARPRWRDALVLAVLAAVIVGGLVHYGRGLGADDTRLRRRPPRAPRSSHVTDRRGHGPARGRPADRPGRAAARPRRRHLLGRPRDHRAQAVRAARGRPRAGVGVPVVRPTTAPCATRPAPTPTATPWSSPTSASSRRSASRSRSPTTRSRTPPRSSTGCSARVGKAHMRKIPGATRRPLHLQGRPQPPGADHRACTSSSPTSSRSTPRARRPPSGPGEDLSGSARRRRSAASATPRAALTPVQVLAGVELAARHRPEAEQLE